MSFFLTGTLDGVPAALQAMAQIERRTQAAVLLGMGRGIKRGEGIVKGKVSGRPGPRNVTGDFRRTIVGDYEAGGDTVFGQIGTNAAQGARLELGFVGVDVLGRRYNQPPYPYLGPSVPEITQAVSWEIQVALEEVRWAA